MLRFFFIFLFSSHFFSAESQEIIPVDGSSLTQTSVLFEVPEVIGAVDYEFQVFATDGSERVKFIEPNQAVIVDGLSFGKNYRWTVLASNEKRDTLQFSTYSFDIGNSPLIDSNLFRFNCIRQSVNSKVDGLLFLDHSRVAITPEGVPVWFMPYRKDLENRRLRDFKLTARGSLTYLDVTECEEIELNGTRLWVTPSDGFFSGDSRDYFHHEFTRLKNGNYIVLGKTFIESDLMIGDKHIKTIPLSILIEFNEAGKVVWTWSSNQYITEGDILKVGQKISVGNTFGHMNSFFVDELNGVVYVGFRDLNCILAIDKASGDVLQSYGDKIPSDLTQQAIGFFSKQHAPIKVPGDKLLLFNNNDRKKPSSLQIISEVTDDNPQSKIEWEFVCDFDTLMPSAAGRMGNALLLEEGNILANMGQVARIFEVSQQKEVLWQCFPQKWDEQTLSWKPKQNYRVFNASSLYPFYFTIALQKVGNEAVLRIDNEGSEKDSFEIRVFKKENKKRLLKQIVSEINAKNSTLVNLKDLYKSGKIRKSVIIEVRSLGNPDRVLTRKYSMSELK